MSVEINAQEVLSTNLDKLALKPEALPGLKRQAGRIGFQSHTGTVRFSNIRIKDLSQTSETVPLSEDTKGSTGKGAAMRRPPDAKKYLNEYYKVFAPTLSWHEAKERCRQMGGRLAVVKSEGENQFLLALMNERGVDAAWLGATDEQFEGRWQWADGTPMRYSNWSPVGKQPNNKRGLEHYLVIWKAHQGKWSDQPNLSTELKPGFICQWD